MSARKQLIERAEALVKDHMAKYDPSHDWAHVARVRGTAMRLAKTFDPAPDMLVVELTALFHDMAAKYGETSSLPTLLQPFFNTSDLPQSQIDLIQKIIPSISYSTETRLIKEGKWSEWHQQCPELHIVQDSDRLDAIGMVGVFRCAAFSGAMGRTLLGKGEGVNTAEQHFYDKLLNVKDRMKTEAGKKEAEKRHQNMLDFLRALDSEGHDSEP